MFTNAEKASFFLVAASFISLIGCVQTGGAGKNHEPRQQCIKEFNGADRPCQTSAYSLAFTPGMELSGLYVEMVAYYPGRNAKLLFVNKDAAEYEDYSSSFLIVGESKALSTLSGRAGYVRVVMKFDRDLSDYGVGSGVYRQLGVLSNLVRVRPIVSMESRSKECETLGCTISYHDGSK